MKVLILGADGKLGKLVTNDLVLKHKTEVWTLTRKPFDFKGTKNFIGSPENIMELEKAAKGADVIISTLGAATVDDFKKLTDNTIKVAEKENALLIWSGGAGSLVDKNGQRLIDNLPDNEFFKVQVLGQNYSLSALNAAKNLKFVYVSPAETMDYDRDEKAFKIEATDKALYNSNGESAIGYKTQAAVLASLVDNNKEFLNKRVTSVETN